jgi:hypothetical protein
MAMRLSLAVFAAVMLGTLGLIGFSTWPLSGGPGGREATVGLAVIAAVVLVVIVFGVWQTRPHLRAAGSRQISVATGRMEVVSAASNDYHVRIGPTRLRLASVEQLRAFAPGTEYRVHYLAAPVALVLSAESLGGGADDAGAPADADGDAAERAVAGDQITVVRRGSVIVVLLGVLALGIPIAGIAGGALSERLRPVLWIGLLAVAVGFAWFAIRWLSPRRPGSSDFRESGPQS